MRLPAIAALLMVASLVPFPPSAPPAVEVLTATSALPAHLAGTFADPIGFVQAMTGQYLVLDRRAHTVYLIDAKQTTATQVLQVGFEQGRLLGPAALAIS